MSNLVSTTSARTLRRPKTMHCIGLGYGSGTPWSNDMVSTTQIDSIGNGFARVDSRRIPLKRKRPRLMHAMSYVRPRCGPVTYGSHVADGNGQLFQGVLTNDSSLVCPRNLLALLMLVSLKTESRASGYRLSACLRALLPALVSVGNPGYQRRFARVFLGF